MQRRQFIATLAGALGAVVGIVKGGSALVAEAKAQRLATGGPIGMKAGGIGGGFVNFEREGREGFYTATIEKWGVPQIHVGQVNGHVDRIWFDNEMVYQCPISKHAGNS